MDTATIVREEFTNALVLLVFFRERLKSELSSNADICVRIQNSYVLKMFRLSRTILLYWRWCKEDMYGPNDCPE